MSKFCIVVFSILLALVLDAHQTFVPSPFTISGAQAQSAAKKEQKVTATIALPGVQVETLNPYAHSTTQIYPTWKHVIEPLVEWSWSKKQIVPLLAESWSNPDHSTWVFKLKKGIKFHDGSDFTSADVVHSFTRIQKDPDSKQGSSIAHVIAIEAVDPLTVRLRTKSAELLAAKAASFGNIAGNPSGSTGCQLKPPSSVVNRNHLPSIGSPKAIPCRLSQNASPSKSLIRPIQNFRFQC